MLTSPAMSPRFGPIGLAIVPAAIAARGTAVQAVTADGAIPGSVDVLSIYDPTKERPRG
jgi:glycine cleavage system aminomethyltransferase T